MGNTKKSQLDEAIFWLEEGRWASEPSEADWQHVFTVFKGHLEQNPLDSRVHFVLGYAYFSKGENSQFPEIETHLLRSLELMPGAPFPLFFLGMYYFNCGSYEKSLASLSQIDLPFFSSIEQHYRIAEVLEVKLCDRLYLQPEQVAISEIADFAESLFRLAELDAQKMEGDAATFAVTPFALTRCIDSLFRQSNLQEKAEQMFDIVFELLFKLDKAERVAQTVERVRIRLESTGNPDLAL